MPVDVKSCAGGGVHGRPTGRALQGMYGPEKSGLLHHCETMGVRVGNKIEQTQTPNGSRMLCDPDFFRTSLRATPCAAGPWTRSPMRAWSRQIRVAEHVGTVWWLSLLYFAHLGHPLVSSGKQMVTCRTRGRARPA